MLILLVAYDLESETFLPITLGVDLLRIFYGLPIFLKGFFVYFHSICVEVISSFSRNNNNIFLRDHHCIIRIIFCEVRTIRDQGIEIFN